MQGPMPLSRAIMPALCALFLISIVPTAGADRPASAAADAAPLIGYNDNFNTFELTRRNRLEDTLPPGVPIDPVPPLPGDPPPRPESSAKEAIEKAKRGGADVVRYVVPWLRVERQQGYYDFGVDDQTYDLVLEAGLKPLIIIMTSPCWAHPSVDCQKYRGVRPDPQYLDDFARFAKATMERYPEAAAFEVWNESNFRAFWGTTPSPGGYIRLLKAVSEQAETISPRPKLLYNGMIPKKGWEKYMKRSYKRKGAGNYADAAALHPYVGGAGVMAVKRQLKDAKRILRESGARRKVWVTEIGWSTNPEADGAVGPAGQAARVEKLIDVATKMRLPAIVVHRLQDLDHSDAWESGLGALRRNDSAKPLFCMLRAHRPRGAAPSGC